VRNILKRDVLGNGGKALLAAQTAAATSTLTRRSPLALPPARQASEQLFSPIIPSEQQKCPIFLFLGCPLLQSMVFSVLTWLRRMPVDKLDCVNCFVKGSFTLTGKLRVRRLLQQLCFPPLSPLPIHFVLKRVLVGSFLTNGRMGPTLTGHQLYPHQAHT
jgi:hypothetical protein